MPCWTHDARHRVRGRRVANGHARGPEFPQRDPRASHERRLAERIWRSVVPPGLGLVPDYVTDVHTQPADLVGGDFHLLTQDGWLVVGDVSGKGMPAALMTGMFVAALRLAVRAPDPAAALELAVGDELERAGMFTTLLAVRLAADGRIQVLNAGHPPLIVAGASGRLVRIGAGAPPIGVARGTPVPLVALDLAPGDTMLLSTDGATDAWRGEERFGQDRLESLAAEVRTTASVAPVVAALGGWRRDDDVTLVSATYAPRSYALDEILDRR